MAVWRKCAVKWHIHRFVANYQISRQMLSRFYGVDNLCHIVPTFHMHMGKYTENMRGTNENCWYKCEVLVHCSCFLRHMSDGLLRLAVDRNEKQELQELRSNRLNYKIKGNV